MRVPEFSPTADRPRILFVDDDPDVLAGIRQALHRERKKWEILIATSGEEALEMMISTEIDIVVTDMHMPGMDGSQLLRTLTRYRPGVVRIVLSGEATPEQVAKSASMVHRWLPKPCDRDSLVDTLNTALQRRVGGDDKLDRLVGGVLSLPSSPRLYTELLAARESNELSFEQVAKLVERDPAVNAKLLQWGRSPLLGASGALSVREVIAAIGLDALCQLVVSIEVLQQMNPDAEIPGLTSESLGIHAELTAEIASRLVTPVDLAVTRVAGLLHSVGLLVLTTRARRQFEDAIGAARERGTTFEQVAEDVLGLHHADVGARLLGLWDLPSAVCDAVGGAPRAAVPLDDDYLAPAAAVRVASALAAQLVIDHHGVDPIWALPLMDDPELRTAPWWNRAVNAIVDVHGEYADPSFDHSPAPQEALLL